MNIVRGIVMLLVALIVGNLVFFLALTPQILLAGIIRLGGGIMLLNMTALYLLGALASERLEERDGIGLIAALVGVSALLQGGYWHIFARGAGFFSANRVSAAILFIAAFYAVDIYKWCRARAARLQPNQN